MRRELFLICAAFQRGWSYQFLCRLMSYSARVVWHAGKWSRGWKRGAESAKRLISAKLLCNSFAFHLFLWSILIQYCVFRQKNARKVRNVLAGGSGVFVLLRKFCQMDCKRSCCFQQCFPHFWWTSKIDCIQFSALTFQFWQIWIDDWIQGKG